MESMADSLHYVGTSNAPVLIPCDSRCQGQGDVEFGVFTMTELLIHYDQGAPQVDTL